MTRFIPLQRNFHLSFRIRDYLFLSFPLLALNHIPFSLLFSLVNEVTHDLMLAPQRHIVQKEIASYYEVRSLYPFDLNNNALSDYVQHKYNISLSLQEEYHGHSYYYPLLAYQFRRAEEWQVCVHPLMITPWVSNPSL